MEHVLILMSTYNGERYLREQLESLVNQQNVQVSILVRDDGSTDGTISILEDYKQKGALSYYSGPNLRPARSFMHLVMSAPESDYYAFCDQDDVWMSDKLITALNALKENSHRPALYYHGMNIVDNNLNKYGYYYRAERYSKSLKNSCLFGDEIAGCTMVWNKNLHNMLKKYEPQYITMHDGWIHRVCLCVGGNIIGNPNAYINYRQHGNNVVGMPVKGITEQFKAFCKSEHNFSRLAREMIRGYQDYIPAETLSFLNAMANYKLSVWYRVRLIKEGVVSQGTLKEKLKLCLKVLFRRI